MKIELRPNTWISRSVAIKLGHCILLSFLRQTCCLYRVPATECTAGCSYKWLWAYLGVVSWLVQPLPEMIPFLQFKGLQMHKITSKIHGEPRNPTPEIFLGPCKWVKRWPGPGGMPRDPWTLWYGPGTGYSRSHLLILLHFSPFHL